MPGCEIQHTTLILKKGHSTGRLRYTFISTHNLKIYKQSNNCQYKALYLSCNGEECDTDNVSVL